MTSGNGQRSKLLRRGEMVSHQSHKLKIVGSIPTVRNQIDYEIQSGYC